MAFDIALSLTPLRRANSRREISISGLSAMVRAELGGDHENGTAGGGATALGGPHFQAPPSA